MGIDIERRFVRIAAGLVHFRFAGPAAADGPLPLYLAHSGPGSSLGLVPMMQTLARSRHVIAPDLLGNGDSDPHALAEPGIADYADDAVSLLDAQGIARVDFYGRHTGALVGCELALRHPSRVRRLVLDGLSLFSEDLRTELLTRYAPAMAADGHGGHLLQAWSFVRELTLHFPHYLQDPEHRLHHGSVPAPAALHLLTLEVLKALPTYHLAYRAAFRHATAERLALLRHDTLVMAAAGDPLERYLDAAAATVGRGPGLRVAKDDRAETVRRFVDA
jgi:pimeloyl-ACP methyl ester carboxylesterase